MNHEEQWQWICRMEDEHRAQKQMWQERERKERHAQELLTMHLELQTARTTHWLMYLMFNPAPSPEVAAAILGEMQ